jgi:hypothetical protein
MGFPYDSSQNLDITLENSLSPWNEIRQLPLNSDVQDLIPRSTEYQYSSDQRRHSSNLETPHGLDQTLLESQNSFSSPAALQFMHTDLKEYSYINAFDNFWPEPENQKTSDDTTGPSDFDNRDACHTKTSNLFYSESLSSRTLSPSSESFDHVMKMPKDFPPHNPKPPEMTYKSSNNEFSGCGVLNGQMDTKPKDTVRPFKALKRKRSAASQKTSRKRAQNGAICIRCKLQKEKVYCFHNTDRFTAKM